MAKLKDYFELQDTYAVIDLIASEYGWTISEIQNLTIPEISCLLRCILKRHGAKEEDLPSTDPKKQEAENLIKLAKKLNAKPEQLKALNEGKKIDL